jgi:hypothetical protein
MLKKIFHYIKKVILAGFTLFIFNLMISPLNIILPINLITVFFVSIFGIISLPFLTLMLIFFF